MRTDDVRKLTKDTLVILKEHHCLLHSCDNMVYLLSNLEKYDGSTCRDFSKYSGQYSYSFWLVDKDDGHCDNRYAEICQQLCPYSLGGL